MNKLYQTFCFLCLSLLSFSQSTISQDFVREEFSDNSNGWNLSTAQNADNLGFIADGYLNIERVKIQGSSSYLNQNIKVNVEKPFQINTLIHTRFRGWGYQGLVLSNIESGEYLLFATDSFGVARVIYHSDFEDVEIFQAELEVKGTKIENHLEISRVDNNIIFSQNKTVLNVIEVPPGFEGEYAVGFYMSQKQSARVDYLSVKYHEEKEVEPMVDWVYPTSAVTSLEEAKTTLQFSIPKVYLYQKLTLKVNNKETNLFHVAPEVSKAKEYYFEIDVFLERNVNTIELEYLDHNGLLFKKRKLFFKKKEVYHSKNHALLFATDDYRYWADLANPVKDMDSLANILSNLYGFEVTVIKNASRDSIMKQLELVSETFYGDNEQLLVFFTGHGAYDEQNETSYFVCPESRTGKISSIDHVKLKDVKHLLDKSLCTNICLMTDICFGGQSGSLKAEKKEESVRASKSRYFIASGRGIVSDGKGLNGHSPFTIELLDFLVKKQHKNSLDLHSWVRKLQTRNKDIVFREFGVGYNSETNGQNFQFILK